MNNFFRNLFFKRPGKDARLAAFYGCGQVVIAYYCRYACESVSLDYTPPVSARVSLNFGKERLLVQSILSFTDNPDLFGQCRAEEKLKCFDIAPRLLMIFLAGALAKEMKQKGRQAVTSQTKTGVPGPDQIRLQNVSGFLSQISLLYPGIPILNAREELMVMLKIPRIWESIEALTKACTKNKGKKLNQECIEKVLRRTGYLNFIREL